MTHQQYDSPPRRVPFRDHSCHDYPPLRHRQLQRRLLPKFNGQQQRQRQDYIICVIRHRSCFPWLLTLLRKRGFRDFTLVSWSALSVTPGYTPYVKPGYVTIDGTPNGVTTCTTIHPHSTHHNTRAPGIDLYTCVTVYIEQVMFVGVPVQNETSMYHHWMLLNHCEKPRHECGNPTTFERDIHHHIITHSFIHIYIVDIFIIFM